MTRPAISAPKTTDDILLTVCLSSQIIRAERVNAVMIAQAACVCRPKILQIAME